MREILDVAAQWVREGAPFAVATVVARTGSAPREVGASMAIRDSHAFGGVSGGCVEGAVVQRAAEVVATGESVLETYGIEDADSFAVGLSCGGSVQVLIRPVLPGSAAAREILLLQAAVAAGVEAALELVLDGERTLSLTLTCAPHLIVIGAVEVAAALTRLALASGYRVTVVDPRAAFAVPERFGGAEVVCDWPHRYLGADGAAALGPQTAVAVLSHDARIDAPALAVALGSAAGYVGAMGSRRTHAERLDRLREAGASDQQIARLRSPIGLDLGGRGPEATALAILAEITADRHRGSGRRLSETSGALHRDSVATPDVAGDAACTRAEVPATGLVPAGE
ncbi:XdhC family protein [Serinibacter salmoneus]|uniref:Xanthine dehydrogenase accessory factor n=1 Tax=Serinibacter salmoneus TaxID=556530 RepID=A0A2A9CX95_9MICO|nr:XdhC family protein [Serinibacter salmoneus]PFG18761.1 xanthine dehydrogenase accessory factor [Serinibacter salmoneus]